MISKDKYTNVLTDEWMDKHVKPISVMWATWAV